MSLELHTVTTKCRLTPRVVLLGASNLTRAISTVVDVAGHFLGRPVDVLAALGHGRSYGIHSSVLGRTLPGILDCGLWDALANSASSSTAALLTDIGNDIFYGVSVSRICEWVNSCLDRLQEVDARIVMTLLPVDNIELLSPWRFRFFKAVLFPHSNLNLIAASRSAFELNDRLRELGSSRGIQLVKPDVGWYGLDPIHIKIFHWRRAWCHILKTWSNDPQRSEAVTVSLRRWLYLKRLCPEQRWILGIEQRRLQPVGSFGDGTTIALY